MLIRLGPVPDPDDAFMFWALAEGEIDTRGFEFEHVLQDIQTLNEWALEARLEVTALSLHSTPHVRTRTSCSRTARAWALGTARRRRPARYSPDELREVEIAIRGR